MNKSGRSFKIDDDGNDVKLLKKDIDSKSYNGKARDRASSRASKRDVKETGYCGKRGGRNDVKWYSKYPQMIKDSANLPFNSIAGLPVKVDLANKTSAGLLIPGIMRVDLFPTIGLGLNADSNVNITAKKIYSFIRHANSGSANYESSDLMMYLIACGNIYAFISALERLYGCLRTYNERNRYWCKGFVQSLDVDLDDLVEHANDLRGLHNYLVAQMNSFATPRQFSFFEKMFWIQSGVYGDSESEMAQLYYFHLTHYLRFSGTKVSTGSALEPVRIAGSGVENKIRYTDLKQFGLDLINSFYNDEDIGIMSGDILKAYKDDIWKLGFIAEDYAVLPQFNEDVLWQIQNSIAYGDIRDIAEFPEATIDDLMNCGYVVQENNLIKSNPQFIVHRGEEEDYQLSDTQKINLTSMIQEFQPIFNSRKDRQSPDTNMEGTRLMACATGTEVNSDATGAYRGWIYASEVVCDVFVPTNYNIYRNVTGDALLAGIFHSFICEKDLNVTLTDFANLSQFDWHPAIYVFALPAGDIVNIRSVFEDLDMYTVLSKETLANLHNIALFSEFSVD
nr:putative capsid [Marmot picobirnavirus]